MLRVFLVLGFVSSGRLPRQVNTGPFYANRGSVTYADAEKACEDDNRILAYVPSFDVQQNLTTYLENFVRSSSQTGANEAYRFWIGLKRVTSRPSRWFWKAGAESCNLSEGPEYFAVSPPTGIGGGDIEILSVRLEVNSGKDTENNWVAYRSDNHEGTTGYVCMDKPSGKYCFI